MLQMTIQIQTITSETDQSLKKKDHKYYVKIYASLSNALSRHT